MSNITEWILTLFDYSRKKGVYDMEEQIQQLIVERFNKKAFNLSLLGSVAEKPILEGPSILTRQVLPLSHLYGYIFLTE